MRCEFQNEISACIEKNKMKYAKLLKKLVSFDSVIIRNGQDGNEKEIQAFLADYLKHMGARVDCFEPDNARISKK